MTSYKESGVDIELGDNVSEIMYNAAKRTWANRKGLLGEVIVPVDDFTGVRAIDVSGLPQGTMMNIGFDGVGTKIEIAERLGDYHTIAHDLIAMVCDDAVVRGAEPVLVGSILDVNSLRSSEGPYLEQVRELARGMIDAASDANVAVVNGEVAELGSRVGGYGGFNCNWGAACVWFANRERMFTGHEVKPRDFLIGLREDGFRSNGLSLVRRIMQKGYGAEWHIEAKKYAQAILKPSQVYSKAVVEMFGGLDKEPKAELHGVAHITGGGIPGKLGRMLKPSGLGAVISDAWEPPSIMRLVQERGGVSDEEAYRTWNMGYGMILATPDPEDVIKVAYKHSLSAQVIGRVAIGTEIKIRNMGVFRKADFEFLTFYR